MGGNKYMYISLLVTNVTLDINNLPVDLAIIILSFIIVVVAIIFINGFSIKIGDKEFNVGGIQRLLARKDEDMLLKETLHEFSEKIDREVNGNLYDLVDSLNYEMDGIAINEHCYFTFEKFIAIFRNELEKRVRRNSLKEKLSKINRENYTATILGNVESQYNNLRVKVSGLNCGETYTDFTVIKDAAQKILNKFFDGSKIILIEGCRKKIKKYNEYKDKFKTISARKSSCDHPIEKNEGYIRDLELL